MAEVHYKGKSPEQRIADRYRNSGEGLGADHHVQTGTGPTRLHTNVHHSATNHGSNLNPQGPVQGREILGEFGPDVRGRR